MSTLISARGLSKQYGDTHALDDVSFDIEAGRIVGLIGPNGAGKTTAIKALLGLCNYDGELSVLGLDPYKQRHQLMRDVCFVADVATIPRWLKVHQALDFVEAVHPNFKREKAIEFLDKTDIGLKKKVRHLSKGMVTQLHLALIMAVDAKLLVLDEPTIGLDIIYRKDFYAALLNDYFDEQRTILITTHQVEEIEHILTDLLFINKGKILLDASLDDVADTFVEVSVAPDQAAAARNLTPVYEHQGFGKQVFLFDGVGRDELSVLGETRTPSVADLFVAKVKGAAA